MIVSLIVAASVNECIGADGALPWYLPGDLRRFRELTTGHVVVMGRLTYESILARLGHPLAGRTSVVVSGTLGETGDPAVRVAGQVLRAEQADPGGVEPGHLGALLRRADVLEAVQAHRAARW